MRGLVIDVEATCWEKPGDKVSEIIEIGLTVVDFRDQQWEIGETYSFPIKNKLHEISPFCTQLTGWTQEEINKVGRPYNQVVSEMKASFKTKEHLIINWGKYDDMMFQDMSRIHRHPYPFSNSILNAKALFRALTGERASVGKALKYLGMDFQGIPHRGGDDSYNIARIFCEITRPIIKSQLLTL